MSDHHLSPSESTSLKKKRKSNTPRDSENVSEVDAVAGPSHGSISASANGFSRYWTPADMDSQQDGDRPRPTIRIHRAKTFHNRAGLKEYFRSLLRAPTSVNKLDTECALALTPTPCPTTTNRWQELENCNIVVNRRGKDGMKLYGADKTLEKYLGIQKSRIQKQPEFFVYDMLGNFRNFFYGDGHASHADRKIKIKFPEEVVQQAEVHGDRAGKEREVTRSKVPPRRRQKLRKVYDPKRKANIIDPEIREDTESQEHGGCCGQFVHNFIYSFGFCESYDDKSLGPPGAVKLSQKYRKASQKFGYNLDIVAEFIEGNMKSVRAAESIIRFPRDSEVTEHINFVSAQLWLFTFSIHHLFQGDPEECPTKKEFEDLIEKLEIVAANSDHMASRAITFSEYIFEFGKETMALLSKIGKLLSFKVDTSIGKPIKKRDGLKILTRKEMKDKETATVKVVVRNKTAIKPQWQNFNTFSKVFRLVALGDVAENIHEDVHKLRTHLKFVSEDVVNGKFEDEDPPFLTICILLHDLIKYFVHNNETTKPHLQNLMEVMMQFVNDTRDFIIRTQTMMLNLIEIGDMTNLCFDYMKEEYAVTIITYLPASKVFSQFSTTQKTNCCKKSKCCKKEEKDLHYKAEDFHHTEFRDALLSQWISTPTAQLILKPAITEEIEEEKEKIEVRFSEADGADPEIPLEPEAGIFELKQRGSGLGSQKGMFYNSGSSTGIQKESQSDEGRYNPGSSVTRIASRHSIGHPSHLTGVASSRMVPKWSDDPPSPQLTPTRSVARINPVPLHTILKAEPVQMRIDYSIEMPKVQKKLSDPPPPPPPPPPAPPRKRSSDPNKKADSAKKVEASTKLGEVVNVKRKKLPSKDQISKLVIKPGAEPGTVKITRATSNAQLPNSKGPEAEPPKEHKEKKDRPPPPPDPETE